MDTSCDRATERREMCLATWVSFSDQKRHMCSSAKINCLELYLNFS